MPETRYVVVAAVRACACQVYSWSDPVRRSSKGSAPRPVQLQKSLITMSRSRWHAFLPCVCTLRARGAMPRAKPSQTQLQMRVQQARCAMVTKLHRHNNMNTSVLISLLTSNGRDPVL